MKTNVKTMLTLLALGASALIVNAQNGGGPPDGPRVPGDGHHPPPLPLVTALDTNHDGVIDSNEIANASAALKTLDKNGDGMLTTNEYWPQPLPQRANPNGRVFHPPTPLIVTALDTNHDGVIDSNEIANASAALKTLDKKGDRRLTPDEYIGPPPSNAGGPGDNNAGGPDDNGNPPGPPPDE